MNEREYVEHIKCVHFDKAHRSIERTGQYWSNMTRRELRTLTNMLIEHGLDVIAHVVPPHWDTVIAKTDIPVDLLKKRVRF